MSQNARKRVRSALAHKQPDRVPFSWQFCATPEMKKCLERELVGRGISWSTLRQVTEDLQSIRPAYCGPAEWDDGAWDIWGIEWKDCDYGDGSYREVENYPLAGVDSVNELDEYSWPDPDWYDYDGLEEAARELDETKAVKFPGMNPLETLCWMTGLEEVLCNCAIRPELVVRGLEHIVGFYEERLVRSLEVIGDRVDIVFFFDDLGSQTGPMMSPSTYREVIKPFHQRLFSRAQNLAPEARVMMHSDGSVFALLQDLVDAGLDVLEAVQVDCADNGSAETEGYFWRPPVVPWGD